MTMLEVGTKVMKKRGGGAIGGEVEITKRQVVRDRCNGKTEVIYTVGNALVYGNHTEEGIYKNFLIVDDEATDVLNEEVVADTD
jgi:hypothetical protein